MAWSRNGSASHTKRQFFLTCISLILTCLSLLLSPPAYAQPALQSPDKKYAAVTVSGNGLHYQVKEVEAGRILFTTTAQYPSANDVKAGMFNPEPNSKEFAAIYHYGHKGSYSWVGVWDLKTGKRVREEEKSGWTTDPSFIFKK